MKGRARSPGDVAELSAMALGKQRHGFAHQVTATRMASPRAALPSCVPRSVLLCAVWGSVSPPVLPTEPGLSHSR